MGEMNEQVHRLLLEQRKTLSLGGVQDVKSFDENEVLLVTVCGVLTIRGKELHVGRLELEKGEADNIFFSQKIEHMDIFIVQQSFRHIFQSADDRLQLLFPRYIVLDRIL